MAARTTNTSTWVTRLLDRTGVDLKELRRQLPREFDLVVNNVADTPLDNGLRVLAACEQLTGEPNFGIRLAEKSDFRDMGVYGYLLVNAQTLGQLFELAAKYFGVLIRTSKINYETDSHRSLLTYRILSPTTEPVRHDVDWSFGAYVNFARKVLGPTWQPSTCGVTYERPLNDREHLEFYGPNIEFAAASNYFSIDNDLLEIQINDADAQLLALFRNYADLLIEKVQQHPDFLHHVKLLVMQSVSEHGCSAQKLAADIGMSSSTFNRHLAKHGTNFRQIRDETIRTLACQALQREDLSVSTIALRLGYAESSAFNHAFKRLEGVSPREYRKRTHV